MENLTRHQIYYQKNRERLLEKVKGYREKNYSRFTISRLKYHASIHGRSKRMHGSALKRCEQSGLSFDLTLDWVREKLSKGHCEITGIPFQFSGNGQQYRNPYGPSLDRKDPRGGYTQENCRVILWALNMGFSDWGEGVYRAVAEAYLQKSVPLEYDL